MTPKVITALTRFRLRSHRLGIVKARWTGGDDDAKCHRCRQDSIDDEEHLLIDCRSMDELRRKFPAVFQNRATLKEIMAQADKRSLQSIVADRIVVAAKAATEDESAATAGPQRQYATGGKQPAHTSQQASSSGRQRQAAVGSGRQR